MKNALTFIFIVGATLFSPVSNATFQSSSSTYTKSGAIYSSPSEACGSSPAYEQTNSNAVCGSLDWHWICQGAPTVYVCGPYGSSGTGPAPLPSNATCNARHTECTCNAGFTEVTSFLTGTSCQPISGYIESPSSFAIGAGILGGALTTAMVGVASGTCAVTPMVCAGAIAVGGVIGGGMAAAAFRTSDNQTVIRKPDEGQPTSMELNLHLNGTAQTDTARAQNVGQGNLRPFNGSGASGTWEPHSSGASGTWENSGSWTNPSNGNVTSWNNFLDENNDSSWSSSTTSHAGGGGSLNNASLVAHNGDGTFDYFEYWEEWTNSEGTEKTAHILEATVESDGQSTVTGGGQITFTWNGTSWIATGSDDTGGGDTGGGDTGGGDTGGGEGDGSECPECPYLSNIEDLLAGKGLNVSLPLSQANQNIDSSIDSYLGTSFDNLSDWITDSPLPDLYESILPHNPWDLIADSATGGCSLNTTLFNRPMNFSLCEHQEEIQTLIAFMLFIAVLWGCLALIFERPDH